VHTPHSLLLETLISVAEFRGELRLTLGPESWSIYEYCRSGKTIMEICAELAIPLGVVRVLVSDLAEQGLVRVHPAGTGSSQDPQALLQRVLRGLQSAS
jgi:hypothetical protein